MRMIARATALLTVAAMPALAYGLALAAYGWWGDIKAVPGADAEVAIENGLCLAFAAAGAAIAAYLAITGWLMVLATALRGGRRIPRAIAAFAPAGWTRVTATALGLSLSAGLAGPALAAEDASGNPSGAGISPGWVAAPVAAPAQTTPSPAAVTPSELPAAGAVIVGDALADAAAVASTPLSVGWAVSGASSEVAVMVPGADAAPTPQPETAESITAPSMPAQSDAPKAALPATAYVIQPGDSLWRIAEALLGPDATTSDIAAAWPQLYDANRQAIGADPSLIFPGLALTVPAGLSS